MVINLHTNNDLGVPIMYYKLVESKGEFDLKDPTLRKKFTESSEMLDFLQRELHRGEVKRTWQVFEESKYKDKIKFTVTLEEQMFLDYIGTVLKIEFSEKKPYHMVLEDGKSIGFPFPDIVSLQSDANGTDTISCIYINFRRVKEEFWPVIIENLKNEPLNLPNELLNEIISLYYPPLLSDAETEFYASMSGYIAAKKYMELVELARSSTKRWFNDDYRQCDYLYQVAHRLSKIQGAEYAAFAACCRAQDTVFEPLLLPLRQSIAKQQLAKQTTEAGKLQWQTQILYISFFANKTKPNIGLLSKADITGVLRSIISHPSVKNDIEDLADLAFIREPDFTDEDRNYPVAYNLIKICKNLSDSLIKAEAKLEAIASSQQQATAETEDTTHFKNLSLMYDRLNQKSSANAAEATANSEKHTLKL